MKHPEHQTRSIRGLALLSLGLPLPQRVLRAHAASGRARGCAGRRGSRAHPCGTRPGSRSQARTGTPAPAAAAPAAPATVKVSLFSWPGYGFWFIAKEKNLVPEIALDIQIIEDPYESFDQMAAGQLDVTSSTVEYGPIAAEEGVPVKLVAYTNPSYGTDKIILAPGINGASDLVGKGSGRARGRTHPDLHGHLAREETVGPPFDQVKYTNLIMDDAVAAMVSGKVAAGEFWEPFGSNVPQGPARGQGRRHLEGSLFQGDRPPR
jgi:ABC-type nitrate/sulfonate/bicarbonate transport system substrate-binding protein